MDDFSDQISKILSDPQAMEQIKSMAGMLGAQQSQEPPQPPPQPQYGSGNGGNMISPEMLGAMSKIMPLLSEYKREDNGTRLLAALRPFLSRDKQKKLDEATRMLQMMRFLPMITKLGGMG